MKRKDIEHRLFSIFKDIFNVKKSELKLSARRGELNDWDSLGHVRLIAAIEEEFSVTIPFKKAVTFKDISSIVKYLKTKLSN